METAINVLESEQIALVVPRLSDTTLPSLSVTQCTDFVNTTEHLTPLNIIVKNNNLYFSLDTKDLSMFSMQYKTLESLAMKPYFIL